MYLFLSEILTQIALLYHITQTLHDLLLNSSLITSSKWPFWKLMVLVGLSMGALSLVTFISVSTFQFIYIFIKGVSNLSTRKVLILILKSLT